MHRWSLFGATSFPAQTQTCTAIETIMGSNVQPRKPASKLTQDNVVCVELTDGSTVSAILLYDEKSESEVFLAPNGAEAEDISANVVSWQVRPCCKPVLSKNAICFEAGGAIYTGWEIEGLNQETGATEFVFARDLTGVQHATYQVIECPCGGDIPTVPDATDDVIDATTGVPFPVNVSTNDIPCASPQVSTWVLLAGSEVNATVSPPVSSDGLFNVVALADGPYSFDYEIYCDGIPSGQIATVSGESTTNLVAIDDIVPEVVTDAAPQSVSVASNDLVCPAPGPSTFTLVPGSEQNAIVSGSPNTTGNFSVAVDPSVACCKGDWSFDYEISCPNGATDVAQVSGTYCRGDQTGAFTTTTSTGSQLILADADRCVELEITSGAGGAVYGATVGSFNPGGTFWSEPLAGEPSAQLVIDWDVTPGAPFSDAAIDSASGTITVRFSCPATNPVLHIDRLGGNANQVGTAQTNSLELTLVSGPTSLTRLAGTVDFLVNGGNTIVRQLGAVPTPTSFESGNTLSTTAAGSVQLNGTFTEAVFSWTGVGVEAGGGDGLEFIITGLCNG